MAVICSKYHRASSFTYHPDKRWFVGTASDLDPKHSFDGVVYDDACDVGFTILGRKHAVLYSQHSHRSDREGEIQVWIYRPICRHTGRAVKPGEPGYGTEVHIIND
jgi:hypothetical protein